MAQPAPEVLAQRMLIARRVDQLFRQIQSLVAEADLPSCASIVMSDGQPVDLLEWARLDTKLILEEPRAFEIRK